MTAQIGDRIANIQKLSDQVNSTSTATELQGVVLSFAQNQLTNSIDMKITKLQQIENNMNANDTNIALLDNKISNLTALKENINNTTSIGSLMAIMPFFHSMLGMRDFRMMHHRTHHRMMHHRTHHRMMHHRMMNQLW
jgi:hypothetical protein